jgi:hypothetical protein
MKHDDRLSEQELDALLARGRIIRRVPDVARARALARARAIVAAEPAATPVAEIATPRRGRGRRIAVAASVALLLGAAGAAAAIRVWTPGRTEPTSAPRATSGAGIAPREIPRPPMPVAPQPAPVARAHRVARPVTPQESYRAELDLLQRAQVAYAARDFSGALVLVSEHARRFPNGRLAEEREALRVRSLVGSDRPDEARRAAAVFANRFPRSVLLPRLRKATLLAE